MNTLEEDIKRLAAEYKRQKQMWDWAVKLNVIIGKTANSYVVHYNKQHEKLNITQPNLSLLYVILESGGKTTQRQLSRTLPTTKQAIALSLGTLERKGLIKRGKLSNDHRKRQVQLTEKGMALLDISLPLRNKFYTKLVKHISKDKMEKLTAAIGKLHSYYQREARNLARKNQQTNNWPPDEQAENNIYG